MAHIRLIIILALCLGFATGTSAQQAQWKELNEQVSKLHGQGKYAEAIPLAQRSLEVAERTFGANHRNVAFSLNWLAGLYNSQGKSADAEPLYKRGLAMREKALGPDHPDVANSLNNLAGLYKSQGKYADAEPLFKRSLTIYEKAMGASHPNVATTLNNLAVLYLAQGKYADAEPLYKRSLAIDEKSLGSNHPSVATTLNNLALLYESQGKYAEAEPLYKRSLAIREKALGPNHPDVAHSLNNLAGLYKSQGKYADAEPLYKRSLAIGEKALGPNHPDVATSLNNLAVLYGSHGKYAAAEPLYERSLTIREKALGPDHPNVATSLNNLAVLYKSQGKYADADPLFKRSLEIREKAMGPDHPSVATSLNNLAGLYESRGKYAAAEPLYKRSLAIREKALGSDHPSVATSLNDLAVLYKSQGKYADAEPLYKRSLAIDEKALGPNHPDAATSLNNLGQLYADRLDHKAALEHFERALAIFLKKNLPGANWTRNLIANLYLDRGDFARAEPLVKESGYNTTRGRFYLMTSNFGEAAGAYDRVIKGAEKNRNADSLFAGYTGLGMAYEGLGDYKKAEEYFEKGMNFTEELRSSLLPSERKNFFDVRIYGFSRAEPSKGLTRVRMKLNEGSGSIDSSEATKARALSDNIALRSEISPRGIPKEILDKEDSLVTRVAALKKELAKTDKEKQGGRYENLSKEVQDAETDLKAFVEMLWQKHKPYAAVKYPRPVTLKESALKPGEWVVMFDVSSEGVGVKLIKGKEVVETHYRKYKLEDLERDVKSFRQCFEELKPRNYDPELGEALYKKLLGTVLIEVPKGTSLVIIPDGPLAVLPFEALVTGGKAQWTKGQWGEYPEGLTYLGDLYPISYYQSITALTLARTMGEKKKPGDKMLVLADPVFHLKDERAQAAGSTKLAEKDREWFQSLMTTVEDSGGGFRFTRLPETAVLAGNLEKLYPGKVESFTGIKANKAHFVSQIGPKLDNYRQIVFATHGLFSTKIPGLLEPFLALTMVPPGTDGFLKLTDVMSLRMNADVVALTACQTGLGKDVSGEGVMSMGRAFQYAGARCVLMSLWSVAEKSSVILVESFFRNLKEGKGKLEALKQAREEIRKAGYEHPFYWAPFILVGEVD